MEVLNLVPLIYERFLSFLLIMTRVSALLSMFTLFRSEFITGRVVVALAAIISVIVLVISPYHPMNIEIFSIAALSLVLFQILIGFLGGTILNIVFEAFIAVGQIISTQIGLSMASLIDPRFGNITNLTHFYLMVTALLFFLLNGHLFMIKTIIDSFTVLPVDKSLFPMKTFSNIFEYSGVIFSGGILLSITIIVCMLLMNLSLAVMTKFAPQFNLFSIGINMALILGLICAYMTFNLFIDQSTSMIEKCLSFFQQTFAKIN